MSDDCPSNNKPAGPIIGLGFGLLVMGLAQIGKDYVVRWRVLDLCFVSKNLSITSEIASPNAVWSTRVLGTGGRVSEQISN